MLDMFKKKPIVAAPTDAPQANPTMPVFKTGEEKSFKDPKTGEFVYQRPISDEDRKAIMGTMQKNSQLAQQFIGINRQRIVIEKQIVAINDAIEKSEKEINDVIVSAREKMKLPREWGLNPNLMILEKRVPPGE